MLDIFKKILKKINNISKKIFLIFLVYAAVISLFIYIFTKEQPKSFNNNQNKSQEQIYQFINNPELKKTKQGRLIISLYQTTACSLAGEACTNNSEDSKNNFNHSLFGLMSNLITAPYRNPPASGVYWTYATLEKAGFVPKTYAAEGIGFAALRPFMNLWKVFRDLAYILLVLVLITIGFMIMFRAKLNPQTIISVENALPKIVISLLLITFSFPIAGFLIDLMYVIIVLVIAILGYRGNFFPITEFQTKYLNADFGTIYSGLFFKGFFGTLDILSEAIVSIIPMTIKHILTTILGIVAVWFVGTKFWNQWFRPILDSINEGAGGSVPGLDSAGGIFELAIKVIVFIAIMTISFILGYHSLGLVIVLLTFATFLFTLFRIFFLLFASYIKIFLLIVFSPFFMLFEAIPGKKAFSYWFKSLFVEILSFPVVIIVFLLSYIIVNVFPSTGNIWQPPFLSQLDPSAFTVLLGIGLLFMTPDIVKLVKQLMGVKDLPISLGIGTFFAGAGTAWTSSMSTLQQMSSLASIQALNPITSKIPILNKFIPPSQESTFSKVMAKSLLAQGVNEEAVKKYFGEAANPSDKGKAGPQGPRSA